MPHVKVSRVPGSVSHVMFLIDKSVGRGGVNNRLDVMLVQFMLGCADGFRFPRSGEFISPPGTLAVDGVCGIRTMDTILNFQTVWHAPDGTMGPSKGQGVRGLPEAKSSLLDAVPPGQEMGRIHGTMYGILGLNIAVAGKLGKDRHLMLHQLPTFPRELRSVLYV